MTDLQASYDSLLPVYSGYISGYMYIPSLSNLLPRALCSAPKTWPLALLQLANAVHPY